MGGKSKTLWEIYRSPEYKLESLRMHSAFAGDSGNTELEKEIEEEIEKLKSENH